MAINTIQNQDISISPGRGSQVTGVFAGIGNSAGISVGGGGATTGTGGTGGGGSAPPIVIAGAGEDGSDLIAFDPMLDEARPGDLITADFMTRLLRRINVLEAAVLQLASGGDVVVPDLFGQPLSAVAAAVNQSAGKLAFGLVLDGLGTEINPQESFNSTRLVLGQHPAPGAEVDEGTELNLLVSIIFSLRQNDAAGGAGGGFNVASAEASGARAAAAPAAGELQRVTDDTPQRAAGGASKGASKARKSSAK